ncbi:MAG: hypothetical protein KTR31_03580 [Myxococcales bacterium]|nr:hypothetical protein [Myxococcales bacterium]
MRRPATLWFLLCCAPACTPEPAQEPPACEPVELEETLPPAGATGVFFRSSFWVRPKRLDATTTLTLTDAEGTVIPGAVELDSDVLRFEPSVGLQADSDYELTASASCGTSRVPFRTGPLGDPLLEDPTERVYELNLEASNWTEPAGMVDVIAGFFPLVEVLVRPTLTDEELVVTVATGTGNDEQDTCLATQQLHTDTFADPYFEATTDAFTIHVLTFEAVLEDLTFSGAWSPDATELVGRFTAMADIRPLVPLIASANDPDEACEVAEGFDRTCVPCPLSGDPYCLPVVVEDIEGVWLPDAVVVDVPTPPKECE